MGNFNIDLLKNDTNEDVNSFYDMMSPQPTRTKSKCLIDNIPFAQW